MTIAGLDALIAANASFPEKVTRAAQAVAEAVGGRVLNRAQALLRSKVKGDPIVFTMRTDVANRQVIVEADFASGQPTEIALWFEYGTAERQQKAGRRTGQIQAVHYMRDAVAGEQSGYGSAMDAAMQKLLQELFE